MKTLRIADVTAGYGGSDVLQGVSLTVRTAERHVILGPNGAGKSTLMLVIAGVIRPRTGSIFVDERDVTAMPAFRRAAMGIRWAGDPRPIFSEMSVEDNLTIGAFTAPKKRHVLVPTVYELFPDLRAARQSKAGGLSGGQQQMLAIGQALMSQPDFLCLDEP